MKEQENNLLDWILRLGEEHGFLPAGATAAPTASPAPGSLTDDDFPIDPEAREYNDRLAKKRGKERLEEDPGPPIERQDDELISYGEYFEKLREKLPNFGTKESDHAAVQALASTERDIREAKKWVRYVHDLFKWAEQAGRLVDQKDLATAAGKIASYTGKVSSALGKAGDLVSKVREIADWLVALDEFVKATEALKPEDRKSFKHWAGKMERLFDTTAKLVNWSKMVDAAAFGSAAAGVACFALLFVGATFYVAIEALKAGIGNSDAYFTRMHDIIEESERSAAQDYDRIPPRPSYPIEAATPEQIAAMEAAERRRKKQNAKREVAIEAKLRFDEIVFPTLYIEWRPTLQKKIIAAAERGNLDAIDWWNLGFLLGSGPGRRLPNGYELNGIKETVSAADARTEINDLFPGLTPKCPYFEDFHAKELKAHIAGALKEYEKKEAA